jgi:predicted AAA+ superfamily ATPase
MDYSTGHLTSMTGNFFPELRAELGPYLVDKTKLIENIVDNRFLACHVDLVLRPRRCGKSTMLQMLK